MTRYSFGSLSELTDRAISNAIPSIAPVAQHVSVVDDRVIVHPTVQAVIEAEPTFAVAVDANADSTSGDVPPVVTATVIQDTVAVPHSFRSNPYAIAETATSAAATTNANANGATAPNTNSTSNHPIAAADANTTISTSNPSIAAAGTSSTSNPYAGATTTITNTMTDTITCPADTTDNTSADAGTVLTTSNTTNQPNATSSNASAVSNANTGGTSDPSSGVASMEFMSTSSSGKSLAEVISCLRAAPLTTGCALAANSSACTRSYTQKKKKLLVEFVEALRAKSPKYDLLTAPAKVVPDFFPSGGVVAEVYVLLSGKAERSSKVRVLNQMLIDWVNEKENGGTKRRSGPNGMCKWPSPATLNTMVHTFFAATKDYYGWDFSVKDFNFEHGYNGFFKLLVLQRQKEDVSVQLALSCIIIFTCHLCYSPCLLCVSAYAPHFSPPRVTPNRHLSSSANLWREESRMPA